MGHIRIGTLWATRRWEDVIGLVAEGAEISCVAEATTHAWQLASDKVRNDAGRWVFAGGEDLHGNTGRNGMYRT